AKAYEFLGRPDDAARARSHIAKPAVGATVSQLSAGALVAAATATETRTSAARTSPPAPAPSLAELEARVKKNPNDVQAWLALADSPEARIIDANILEDTQLAGLPLPAGAAAPSAPGPANTSGASGSAEVSGTVSIDSRLAGRVQRDATLFIYAKAADSPGAPLAVLRTTASAWPVSFHLDDPMAMIPSRRLSQFDKVVIEARISRSGQATPS